MHAARVLALAVAALAALVMLSATPTTPTTTTAAATPRCGDNPPINTNIKPLKCEHNKGRYPSSDGDIALPCSAYKGELTPGQVCVDDAPPVQAPAAPAAAQPPAQPAVPTQPAPPAQQAPRQAAPAASAPHEQTPAKAPTCG